jgi:transposase
MSYVYEQSVGKYTYLYEATSYRDEDGNPRNRKKPIGKVDTVTGEYIYKQEYLDRMDNAGLPVKRVPPKPGSVTVSLEEIKKSSVRDYGAYYFLREIAEQIGVRDILLTFFPHCWQEILTLAIYLICTEDPFLYCSHWLESTETLHVGSLSSQRISDLLHAISDKERTNFYMAWTQHIREQEFLALDITSISSWSNLIEDVEWGYNRDHEELPQINLCMLMGESSRLPVFQTVYSGSIKDVSTLKSTLEKTTCYLSDDEPVLLVMDKGFYSQKNVDDMLKDGSKMRFLIPVSFTSKFAKKQVDSERKDIDTVTNTIVSGGHSVRGVTKDRAWNGYSLHTHVYWNALKAATQKEDLFAHVSVLEKIAQKDPENKEHQGEFKKHLNIRKSKISQSGYTVSIRDDVIQSSLERAGWLVLISNQVDDCENALSIYRAKDVVEKGFLRLKCAIDLGRLRVHSHESMQNKIFLGFLSLILLSHMNKVMQEKNIYQKMTMKEMLMILKKLKVQYVGGHRILFPLTKEQKEILGFFSIPEPV